MFIQQLLAVLIDGGTILSLVAVILIHIQGSNFFY